MRTLMEPIKSSIHEIALEISKVGLWDWNLVTNNVFYSKESEHILGYSPNELDNTPEAWDKKVHPDDIEKYYRDFNLHLDGSVDFYESEYRILCKDGHYKWILDKGKVVERDHNNKPKRIIGTHSDISTLKTNEEKLNTNLQLITSQNNRLHNFTHIVSHNLKTHIGNLKHILEFYDETSSENEREELLVHLKSISESLTNTIDDLDDLISIKSKSSLNQLNEEVNLYDCVNKVSDGLKIESFNKEVKIHNTLSKNETLITNRSYLESIFYNLISNAIKYADPKKNSQVIIQSISSADAVKIVISDNGIGIDLSKFKNRLFEMYQTFHGTSRKDSRGIGLYITKTQVEALKGSIEVESSLNEGTAFTLTFKT